MRTIFREQVLKEAMIKLTDFSDFLDFHCNESTIYTLFYISKAFFNSASMLLNFFMNCPSNID